MVGVSKSFNPENCVDKNGKNNSNVVADLPLYHRIIGILPSKPLILQNNFVRHQKE